MLLTTLVEYKEKKATTKLQRENKNMVIEKLTKGLNQAGISVLKSLSYHVPTDSLYRFNVNVDADGLEEKLDNLLVEIYGSSEAVDVLYNRCCRY